MHVPFGKGETRSFCCLEKTLRNRHERSHKKTGCDTLVLTGDHLELYNALSYAHALMEILQEQVAGLGVYASHLHGL